MLLHTNITRSLKSNHKTFGIRPFRIIKLKSMNKQNIMIFSSFPKQSFPLSFYFQGLFHKVLEICGCPSITVKQEFKLCKSWKESVMWRGIGSAKASTVGHQVVPESSYLWRHAKLEENDDVGKGNYSYRWVHTGTSTVFTSGIDLNESDKGFCNAYALHVHLF